MRIAIVSDYYLDYVGGAQTSIAEQKASLEDAGHSVYLIAPERTLARTAPHTTGVRVKPRWTVPSLLLPVIPNRPALRGTLREFLTENAVDIVHVQTEFGLAHAVATVAHSLRIPVVHTVHTFYWQSTGVFPTLASPIMRALLRSWTGSPIGGTPFSDRPSDSLLRNLTLSMAKRADVVVSPSKHQGDDLTAAGIERPVVVVPNPISRSARPPAVLTPADVRQPRFVWVARCEPEKRPIAFVEAAVAALKHTGRAFSVDVVGGGSQLGEVRAIAAGHPQIRVHGGLPRNQVLDLIDAASIVVITSVGFDNQPMTIAEAVSRYRGVLFCDAKLHEGLGASGRLTKGSESLSITDAIIELVREPDQFVRLSEGAVIDAATFSGPAYVERISEVYAKAAAEAR